MRPLFLSPLLLHVLAICLSANGFAGESFTVQQQDVTDTKAVIATVEPMRQLVARARIGGTISSLTVKEGDTIAAGQEIAVVADQKLILQMQALDSRILSVQAQRNLAKIEFDRVAELQKRGVSTLTQLDQARTNLDVANRTLEAIQSDRNVLAQQTVEGAVLAPGAGRILSVAVSEGRVVMPGEVIAILAEDKYILRLQLPERHARFMRAGGVVQIDGRGVEAESPDDKRQGKIRLIYPQIQGGRVIADVDVEGLGDYFVGERTRVYVETGKRKAILIPQDYIFRRAGMNYVHLQSGAEIVVQPGESHDSNVEILSGLNGGDVLSKPENVKP